MGEEEGDEEIIKLRFERYHVKVQQRQKLVREELYRISKIKQL